MKREFKTGFTVIEVTVVIVILIIIVGFVSLKNKRMASNPITDNSASVSTADWKTLTIPELKVSFQYPGTWKNFKLTKRTQKEDKYNSGFIYYYDRDNNSIVPFSFSTTSKNYRNFTGGYWLKQAVDVDWNQEELNNNLSVRASVANIKKLSDKALLAVINDADSEGSFYTGSIMINIPFSKSAPNLYLDFGLLDKYVSSEQMKVILDCNDNDTVCDARESDIYKSITDSWFTNGYPKELQEKIDIAIQIADSVKQLP